MDVISDSCSITSLIVATENFQLLSFPYNILLKDGEQVSRVIGRPIPELARLVTTCRIEVSERNELAIGTSSSKGFDHHFDTEFGLSVGTDGKTLEGF